MSSPLHNNTYINYVIQLDLEALKESLRFAATDVIRELANQLTDNQYQYACRCLPEDKAQILRESRTITLLTPHLESAANCANSSG